MPAGPRGQPPPAGRWRVKWRRPYRYRGTATTIGSASEGRYLPSSRQAAPASTGTSATARCHGRLRRNRRLYGLRRHAGQDLLPRRNVHERRLGPALLLHRRLRQPEQAALAGDRGTARSSISGRASAPRRRGRHATSARGSRTSTAGSPTSRATSRPKTARSPTRSSSFAKTLQRGNSMDPDVMQVIELRREHLPDHRDHRRARRRRIASDNWLKIKNGYPLQNSWGLPIHPKTDQETAERIRLLTGENAQLRAELGSVKDRLRNARANRHRSAVAARPRHRRPADRQGRERLMATR